MQTQPSPAREVPRITVPEAKALVDQGRAVLFVDVRARPEYDRSHIPGAFPLPLRELPQRYDELPDDRLLIPY